MAVTSLCPDSQLLQRLVLGQVPSAEAAPLGEHLLHCEQCARTLHTVKAEDTLVEALRAGIGAGADSESGVIEDLIHRLEKLRSSFAAAEASATLPPAVPTSGEAAHSARPTPTVLPSPEGTVSLPAPFRTSAPEEATEVGYDFLATAQSPDELGRLGAYRVLKVLGAGGMGVVFQAEDTHLERMVALKVMLPAIASNPSARRRFLLEAKAAASIEHDHIVPIFHVGEDRGTPFLAMPLLKGESLDERLKREGKLPTAVVLRIGRETAEGLAAAHERGLIHRDIKPGNIWLEGDRARVKILDFGLVRAAADTTHATKSGAIVGTPAYMAPEQTRGGAVDSRADLFSLGCVLYRMATGELPFKGEDTMSILASLALDNPLPPRERDANIPAALSDLVMQLLAKKPEDRPQTAQVVVERIRAIEQGQAEKTEVWKTTIPAQAAVRPVESTSPAAGRPRAVSSGRGWVPVAVVVALGSLGVAGYLFGPAVYRIATNQGQLVVEVDDPGVEVVLGKQGMTVHDSVTDRRYTIQPGRQVLPAGNYEVDVTEAAGGIHFSTREFTITRNGQAAVKVTVDRSVADKPAPAEVAKPTPSDGPMAPLMDKVGVDKVGEIRRLVGHTERVHALAFTADGNTLASAGADKTVKLWDTTTGKERATLQVHVPAIYAVAFSKDGELLASGDFQGTVILWDVKGAKERFIISAHKGSAWGVAFSPDGKTLITGGADSTVRFWDVKTGKEQFSLAQPAAVRALALSPDGNTLAVAYFGGGVQLWDVAGRKWRRTFASNGQDVSSVVFSGDGKIVATGGYDRTLRLWNVDKSEPLLTFLPQQQKIESVAYSPDGKTLVTGGGDWQNPAQPGEIRLWDAATGKERASLKGIGGVVFAVAFSPDGIKFATGSNDGIVRLFQSPDSPSAKETGEGRTFAGHTEAVNGVAFSGDGRRAVSSSRDGTVRLWDVDTGKEVRQFESGPAVSVAISADGHRVLAGTLDLHSFGGAILWDADSGKEIQRFPMGRSWPRSVALSADGRRALMTGLWNTFVLWDVETGKQVHSFTSLGQIVTSVTLSPDGRQALSGSDHETFFRLWDVEKGTVERIFKGHDAAIKSLAFSPDGRQALSGNEDGTLRLWDMSNGQELRQYKGHTDSVNSVAFTADGLRAVSGGSDGTVRLWDVSTGKELRSFTGHTGAVLSVAVAPDGRRALSGGEDKSIRLWELPSAGQVRQFDGNTEPIWMVGFAQDGRRVLSVSRDTVRQWDAETGKPADAAWELAKYPTLAVVSPEGRHIVFSYGTQSIYVWDMDPRKPPSSDLFARGAYLTAVAFSGDGKRMIGGNHPLETEPAAVQVWDLSTGKPIRALEGHKQSVRAVALSRDGRLGLSSGPDGVRLWDVEKGEARHSLDRPAVGALAFSPDGRRALLGDGSGAVVLWDLETGKEASSFTGHKGRVNSVAFSPDGLRALSGGDDQTVLLWDATTGKELACYRGHMARVSSVAFSPDGRGVLSGSDDKTVRLWALPETPPAQTGEGTPPPPKAAPAAITPEPLPVLPPGAPLNPSALVARPAEIKGVRSWTIEPRGHRGQVNTVAYSPDSRSLVSSSADGAIRLWDVATGRLVHVFVSPSGLTSLAWSADGTTLAGGCWDQAVRIWDAGSGRLLRTLRSDKETTIQSVAWSPDGKVLASAGGDCAVRLWDVASGRVVYTLKTAQSFAGVYSLAWSPDGKVLAAGSDDKLIRLWDPGSGKLLDVLEGHEGFVHALAWSPDGKILASGSYDHTLRLWEAGSGRVLRVLEGHRDAVYAVAWSPDGKTLASGSADNTVRLWEAGSGRKLGTPETIT